MSVWGWLTIAIVFEISATSCLKASDGLSKLTPSLLTLVFYTISFVSLAISLKTLEIGVAYAIWSGAGTALVSLIGILFFQESLNAIKIFGIALIILGVVILNITQKVH